MTIRAPGAGKVRFENGFQSGLDHSPQVTAFALANSKARIREDDEYDRFALTTNDNSMGNAATSALIQDASSLPSWRLEMGGPTDGFWLQRAAPGASLRNNYTNILRATGAGDVIADSLLVGQATKTGGADGQLAVTSKSSTRATLSTKGAGNPAVPTQVVWNPEATGNSIFARFGTETSFTERGSIVFNRSGGTVSYNTTSDRRAKDLHGEIEDAVERLMEIKTYRGRMHGAEADMDLVIADELQSVAPYAVTGEPDAMHDAIVDYAEDGEPVVASVPQYQQVDLAKLVPLLISALQEQQRQIDELMRR
jgi:hypothetical protein